MKRYSANVEWLQAGLDAESYKLEIDRRQKRWRIGVRCDAMGSDVGLRRQWLKDNPVNRRNGLGA
jgi:hypothetical protein